MYALKMRLQTQSRMRYVSIAELLLGHKYPVEKFTMKNTQLGAAVVCTLRDHDIDGLVEIYLPKSITMTEEEIVMFNDAVTNTLKFRNHSSKCK